MVALKTYTQAALKTIQKPIQSPRGSPCRAEAWSRSLEQSTEGLRKPLWKPGDCARRGISCRRKALRKVALKTYSRVALKAGQKALEADAEA